MPQTKEEMLKAKRDRTNDPKLRESINQKIEALRGNKTILK